MNNRRRARARAPEVCPVCGEKVPRGALACPECGADHNSGWKEDAAAYDGVDLPDEDFSYDDFVNREFGSQPRPPGVKTIWWVTGILLILAFLVMYLYL